MNSLFGVDYNDQLMFATIKRNTLVYHAEQKVKHDFVYSTLKGYMTYDLDYVKIYSDVKYTEYEEYEKPMQQLWKYIIPIEVILRLADPDILVQAFEYKRKRIFDMECAIFGSNNAPLKSANAN